MIMFDRNHFRLVTKVLGKYIKGVNNYVVRAILR